MEKKYRFAGYAMLLLLPLTFAGFYKSYFENFPQFSERINLYDHIHAATATAWLALLVIQPLLIANKKYAAHRTLGKLSYFIFSLFILSFIPQIFKTMRSGNTKALFFPLGDGALLIALYLLAVYNKKNTPRHMRYMIASALVLLSPTAGRILPIFFGWSDIATQNFLYILDFAIFLSLILLDRDIKKSRPYLVAAALFLLHAIVFYWVF